MVLVVINERTAVNAILEGKLITLHKIIMIQSIHKGAVQERLMFPIVGDSGFGGRVGRRHVGSKLAAIQKLIFNQETPLPSRHAYNQSKLVPVPTHHSPSHSPPSPDRQYSLGYYPSEQQLRLHQYDVMQRQSSLHPGTGGFPIREGHYQPQRLREGIVSGERESRKKRFPPRQEQLSEQYYHSLVKMQHRQKEHPSPPPLQSLQNSSAIYPQAQQISHALENHSYRKAFSPTFLSSFI